MPLGNKEPRGELARYAFGCSDKKPGLAAWLVLVSMLVYVIYNITITVEGTQHVY